MPETGLTLTYDELAAQVALFLCGVDDPAHPSLSDQERNTIRRCIQNGLRRFYYPAQIEPGMVWDWSFLKTAFEFRTEVGVDDYLQPFSFGGTVGPLVHVAEDQIRVGLAKTTAAQILSWRQLNLSLASWPQLYAERPVAQGGMQGQRWEIMLWPSPSAVYVFKGTQRIQPLAPGNNQQYLYGGPEHSQTIIEACLAAAELMMGEVGPPAAEFAACLKTSMALDETMHQPEYLGYNGDNRRDPSNPAMRDSRHFENFSPVTVSGGVYS